ncbi:hypothetical protein RRG08_058822 [Elysia crispata]|uniref:G-protein coupled receptors family 1 profile domain-containing protein n=1 Tax=Elysia crispata TaxID=231223 RepID=A0AAE1D0N0_9GAST|nr:hypothetical protein RRG08_058822 [Elysia crispata]
MSCLPPYPKVYLICVTFLLTVAPAVLLVGIYTRIFYWAFLQMQILRQEAKHVLRKQEAMDGNWLGSAQSSVTSEQLRLYTGAAIMLTPTSPFSSYHGSFDFANGNEVVNIRTTIHKIVHILSGLDDKQQQQALSTSVDNRSDRSNKSGRQRSIIKFEEAIAQPPGSVKASAADINVSAIRSGEASVASSAFSRSNAYGLESSPIDTFWGGGHGSAHGASSFSRPRAYVPVTPQGKWMESQLRNYDVDVVRESVESLPDVNENIMCKLRKAEVKAAVMIMALMGSFVLCWLPFFIIQLLSVFHSEQVTHSERKVVILLIVLNCAFDPLTYALMNPPFRAIVARSLQTMCRPYGEPYYQPTRGAAKKMVFKIKLREGVSKQDLGDRESDETII